MEASSPLSPRLVKLVKSWSKQVQETEGVARMELRSWGRWKRAASCLLRHYFAQVRPLTDDGLPLSLAGSEVIAVGEGADDDIEGTVSLEAAGWSQVRRSAAAHGHQQL
jgi:hypothetical protein